MKISKIIVKKMISKIKQKISQIYNKQKLLHMTIILKTIKIFKTAK